MESERHQPIGKFYSSSRTHISQEVFDTVKDMSQAGFVE